AAGPPCCGKTIRGSLCPQCLQRLSSYVCAPMWHHKALSPSYWCIAGFVDTSFIALRSEPRPDPAQKELRGVGEAFRPRTLQRVLRSRKSNCGVVCVLLCPAFRFA